VSLIPGEQQLCHYHLQYVQALPLKDYPMRVMLCHWFLQQCGANRNFTASVIFKDEEQFTKDELQSLHDERLWADEKPHEILPDH
jgi:hypothetical protein